MTALHDLAVSLARLVADLASADDAERRTQFTELYKALQAAGLPEPAAAAVQHAIATIAAQEAPHAPRH